MAPFLHPSKRKKTHHGVEDSDEPLSDAPTPSGSSQPRVETPTRKRASASQTTTKQWTLGNQNLNDLARLAEGTVAGYLGYDDAIHLRRLMWSWPVMKAALVFETILKNKLQANATSILEASIENPSAYDFMSDLDTLVSSFNNRTDEEKQDVEATILANNIMFAGTIFHTARALEDTGLLSLDDAELQAEFANYRTEITRVKGFFVPAFDKATVICPTLGPLEKFKEHAMERYSRAITCIRYLLYQTTVSKFDPIKSKIGKNTYFTSVPVTSDRLPLWMGDASLSEEPGASAIISLMNQGRGAPAKITLQLVREDGTEDDEQLSSHINSYLKRKKIRLSTNRAEYKYDIRDFEIAPQWRDHLRRELLLPKLRCDFSTLTLVAITESVSNDIGPVHVPETGPWFIYDNENPDQVISWSEVQEIVLPGGTFCLEYSLKVVDDDEDGLYPYEYDGGPVQAHKNVLNVATATTTPTDQDISAPESEGHTDAHPATLTAPQPDRKGKGPEVVEHIKLPAEKSYVEGALSGTNPHGIRRMVTPGKLFGKVDTEECRAWHLGVDVSTPAGIDAFTRKVVGTLRVPNIAPKAAINLSGLPNTVREEIETGLAAAASTTLNADLPITSDDASSMESFYKMQKLFTGDETQTGPPLDACLAIANAHFDSWHDRQQTLAKYVLKSLPTVKIKPLGHQITAVIWMILKAYGYIVAPTKEGQAAAEKLKAIRTFGGVLVDNMGLGKTFTSLIYLEWVIQNFTPTTPGSYKPHLILAPAGPVIEQWRQDILKNFKGINLILAYGDSPPDAASSVKWISSKAMSGYPKNIAKFPAGLRYIFDRDNKMAAKTVILTSYDTLAGRTLKKPRRQPGNNKPFKPADWIGKWRGVFHTVMLDEGHKVRNPLTNIHVAVARLNARHHWFITGTPIQNRSSDILGPLNILWPQIDKALQSSEDRTDWLETLQGNFKDFEQLLDPDLPATSWKHLIAADPYRIRTLLKTNNKTNINRFYRCMEKLLLLRRSTASFIPSDSHGGKLSLRNLMPPYEITTVQLRMDLAEAAEYQYYHQSFVKDYEEGLEKWAKQKESRIDPTAEIKSFPCVTGPLRAMTVNAVSTLLSRFNETLDYTRIRGKRLDDTVATINMLRAQGFTGLQLAHATMRKGDPVIDNASSLLRHLTFGSPKMKWILKDVVDHCLKRNADGGRNKLLCSEDIPVSAWYIETVLKSIYIRAEVLHSALTDPQRIALIKEFNDPLSDLTVLVMMYQVSSQGANLDKSCHRVCSVTTAINLPSELQVHYRPIRVSQKEKVTIVRLSVVNSHDAWRETKQIDKGIVDVLTKLRSPESFQAIANALNDSRDEVLAAHLSEEGQKALAGRKTLKLKLRQWGKNSVPEETELVAPEVDSEEAVEDSSDEGTSFTPVNKKKQTRKRKRKRAQQNIVSSDVELPSNSETADPTYTPPKYDTDRESNDPFDSENPEGLDDPDDIGVTPSDYISDFKKSWVKLTPEDKALYDQEELNFLVLLSMDPDHVYSGNEIQSSLDSAVTERGLRLVIARRSGQTRTGMKVTPHIKYNALLDENSDECRGLYTAPGFLRVIDKPRSDALRRSVLNEEVPPNPLLQLTKDVVVATLGSEAVSPVSPATLATEHVQGPVLPKLISPLNLDRLRTCTEVVSPSPGANQHTPDKSSVPSSPLSHTQSG